MKKLFLFICCLQVAISFAQQKKTACVSHEEMKEIRLKIKATREHLVRQGKLNNVSAARTTAYNHAFVWPVVAAPNYQHKPACYYISNYVDLNGTSTGGDDASLEDYNCGTRTYDNEPDEDGNGYDHSGIDIAIGPFGWKMMDDENVHVVAAEGGVIVGKRTGEFSRTCSKDGVSRTSAGNYIAIEHSDGVTTYYMHMKNGTLTSKDSGDVVVTGEYLGVVGSSGNSTGPHLHFQVESPGGGILDPFQNGTCNDNYAGLITRSLWANEEPYYNRRILSVFTLSAPWTNASCDQSGVSYGTSEVVPYSNHFNTNSFVWLSAAVRDLNSTTPVRLRVLNPSGTELYDNTFDYNNYSSRVIIPAQPLLVGTSVGTYRLLCTYNGQTETHFFTVGCPASQTLSGNRGSNSGVISGGSINSTETILNTSYNAEYQAETYIQLNPGFTATAGCDFRAKIDPCTAGAMRTDIAQPAPSINNTQRKKIKRK
jgi:murein DD-endopeptidase MepM/ murein hydrolase activator NlpD